MIALIETNQLVLAGVVIAVLLVAWWLFTRASKPAQRARRPDVLDQGAAPAQRNQALIDAPSTLVIPLPAGGILGGIGEVIAAAAHEEVVDAAPLTELAAAADDLTRIKGLGAKINTLLQGLGVTRFAQIAGWSDEDVARIDQQLGTFAGRPARDSWVEQAKLLAAGDTEGFAGKFGNL